MDAPANRHAVHVALQARENHAKKTAHAAAAEKHIREQVEVLKKIRQLEEGVEVARGLMREQRVLREREHAHIQVCGGVAVVIVGGDGVLAGVVMVVVAFHVHTID